MALESRKSSPKSEHLTHRPYTICAATAHPKWQKNLMVYISIEIQNWQESDQNPKPTETPSGEAVNQSNLISHTWGS